MPVDRARPHLTYGAQLAALFVAYFVMAKVGIALPVSQDIISPVWAPAGIALVAFTLGGIRLWPAVFSAAVLANFTSDTHLVPTLGIAVGNVLEPAIGAVMLRVAGFDPALDRVRHLAALCAAGLGSCVLSATNGIAWLWFDGVVQTSELGSSWLLWWFGDSMGVLVASPLLFSVFHALRSRARPHVGRIVEFGLVVGAIVAASMFVFAGDTWRLPALAIPCLTWAALRFRALGSSTATVVIAGFGVYFAVNGGVAYEGAGPRETVQILQAMLTIVGLSMLAIAAALAERDAVNARLARALAAEQDVARELRMIDDMKDRLLAAVSHELRTPLTSILALSTMLEDRRGSIDDAKLGEMYTLLNREAHRLDTLLSDLLDLERLRMGMLEPRYEAVDVGALVQDVASRYATRGDRSTSIDVDDVVIRADSGKLERIVDNLLANAYKHTRPGTPVEVSVHRVDDGVLITVDDHGPGVAPRDKDVIYEPFHRGSAPLDAAPGTGIGLSLVAHFTELHGGRAWVEDRDGGGASFRVLLPDHPATG